MILKVYNDDGSCQEHIINKENFYDKNLEITCSYIASANKEQNALNMFRSHFSNAKSILYDNSSKAIVNKLKELKVSNFEEAKKNKTIFDIYNFSFLFFTSGTTGFPVAALKSKENFLEDLEVLTKLFKKYNIKRVIVSVPFVHFYGSLMGFMYPLINNIDIVLKEHFLPHDLLDLIDDNSLVVTTPLYIKSLNRLNQSKDLSKSIFLSSTAPLFKDTALEFNKKFSCNIIQLFGSTETGGIAYKYNGDELWTPLEKVETSANKDNELTIHSPFVSNILFEDSFKNTKQKIQTFDYVEFKEDKFKLIGRSSQIFKVAGKRYSTVQIENILENTLGINKALVTIKSQNEELRGESLVITLESKKSFLVKEIKQILKNELSNIKFAIELKFVDKIQVSSLGKKLKF